MARRRRGTGAGPTIALAGAGAIAAVHTLAARAAGLEVVAVASAGGTSARHLAGQVDARRVSPDALPAGADLLVVATPPDSHAALALQGMAAGAQVLVEKPVATTVAGADALVRAAAEPGAPLVRVAENLLHAPAWRTALARRATIGALRHLSARTIQPPPTWGHFTGPLEAGGVLFDLGPHPVALVLALAGEEAVGVSAGLSSTRDDGADDRAEVRVRFASGLVAELEVAWTAEDPHWAVQAASDTGVVRLELFPEVRVEADGEPVGIDGAGADGAGAGADDDALVRFGYVDQLLDVAGSQTLEQARTVLEVICAAYASAGAGGAEVPLPNDLDRTLTPMQLWRAPR